MSFNIFQEENKSFLFLSEEVEMKGDQLHVTSRDQRKECERVSIRF